jgi:hypothetical protein
MATDKELLEAFREQFYTGHLFNETQVLILMGYARGDASTPIRNDEKSEEAKEFDERMQKM